MQDYFLQCAVSTVTWRAWLACSLWLRSSQRGDIHMIPALLFACSCQIMSRKTNKKIIQPQSWMQPKHFLGAISLCQQIAYCLNVVMWCPPWRGEICCWEWWGNMPRRLTCLKMRAILCTGFMNNDSLSDPSLKMQFWWYDNAENVLTPWGGSCFSGSVLRFPHYCHAVPETLCQPCCAAAYECMRWWRSDPGGFISVLFWYTVEFLTFAFPSPGTSFFMELSFLGSPRAKVCFQVHWSNSSQT